MKLSQKKYTECLNDLMDYFILADIHALSEYQSNRNLSENLMDEFTSNESGVTAFNHGIIAPFRGIENLSYTIYFTNQSQSIFKAIKSNIQHQKSGYAIKVNHERVFLLTMPLLQKWTKDRHKTALNRPYFDLNNGWYQLEIICGETLQNNDWEPTIEFIFTPSQNKPKINADLNYLFKINSKTH